MAGNPNAMNINNLQVAGGAQDRFRTGAVDMFANSNFGHNAVSAGVQYLKANTMFVDHAVLALHCYIILQANIGANPAVVPSIATFDTPGFFEFSTFKVTHINPHSMTLRRISLLSDDQTAASCVQHAEASFGPIDHDIHFRFPIAGGNAISFLLPVDDAFSITIPDDNLPPGPKLTAYFRIHHTDDDIHLMLAQARAAAAVVAPPPAAAAATRGNRKRNGPQSSGQTARATRSRGAAAATVAAPAAAAAAAHRVSRAAVTAWHNLITTMHPALLNNLPCLYWLSKKVGHPCNASPGCPCTNLNNIRPHVTNPAVVQHMNDITAWLATDPWHRFG